MRMRLPYGGSLATAGAIGMGVAVVLLVHRGVAVFIAVDGGRAVAFPVWLSLLLLLGSLWMLLVGRRTARGAHEVRQVTRVERSISLTVRVTFGSIAAMLGILLVAGGVTELASAGSDVGLAWPMFAGGLLATLLALLFLLGRFAR